MLEEIELLVARAGPEVITDHLVGLTLLAAFLIHIGNTALASERRIGQYQVEALARVATQAIGHMHGAAGPLLVAADAMQKEIHQAEPRRVINNLPAVQRVIAEKSLLVPI